MSQFHWGLRDDVKNMLLILPDLQIFNEAISQGVKCDNCLFQRLFQCPKHQAIHYNVIMTAKSLDPHLEAEEMQIDVTRVITLTPEENKRSKKIRLCFYCGEGGHKVVNCPKKLNRRIVKTRSAVIPENDDAHPQ